MTHVVDRIEFGTDDGQKEYNEDVYKRQFLRFGTAVSVFTAA